MRRIERSLLPSNLPHLVIAEEVTEVGILSTLQIKGKKKKGSNLDWESFVCFKAEGPVNDNSPELQNELYSQSYPSCLKASPSTGSSIAKYFTFPYLVHIHSTPKLNIKLKDNDCNIYSSMYSLLNDFSPGGTSVIVYVAFLSCMYIRQCTCSCRKLNKRVYTHTCGGLRTTPCVILRKKSLRYYPSLTWNWLIRLDLMASKSQGSSCLCVPSVTGMTNAMSPRLDDLTWVLGMTLTSSHVQNKPFTDLAILPYPYCTEETPNFFHLILYII